MAGARIDIYKDVTDRIVEALENGTVPWQRPWTSTGPCNATTGKVYRGINVLVLGLTALLDNRSRNLWLTFKQARALGGHVKKGEHGTRIVFWKFVERESKSDPDDTDRFAFARSYTVFNVDQCEDLPEDKLKGLARLPAGADLTPAEVADQVAEDCGVDRVASPDRCYYAPGLDHVGMPPVDVFDTPEDYAASLYHEVVHWTARRVERKVERKASNASREDYAREELVAEMGAAFLCALAGIGSKLQHAEYIGSWIKLLKDDDRAIFKAASAAQKAADWVAEHGHLTVAEEA